MEEDARDLYVAICRLGTLVGCFPLQDELFIGRQKWGESHSHAICRDGTILLPYIHASRDKVAQERHAVVRRDGENILYTSLSKESRMYDEGTRNIWSKIPILPVWRARTEEFNFAENIPAVITPVNTRNRRVISTVYFGDEICDLRLWTK